MIENICNNSNTGNFQNFSDINTIQNWLAPRWYNDYTNLMTATGWNMSTINNFYGNTSDSNSFGYQL